MCGIAGVCGPPTPTREKTVERMCMAMQHRGPDGGGVAVLGDGQVVLGHRRLAIIDLSENAAQPMHSGKTWITYNGEVYNFKELRAELGGRFKSRSDAEVVARAIDAHGPSAIRTFNGMFALAAWNEQTKSLILARDRYGIKPLYYTYLPQGGIAFASEIRPLLEITEPRLNYHALDQYLTFQNVLTHDTLFNGIYRLPPGHWMEMFPRDWYKAKMTQYWAPVFTSTSARSMRQAISDTRQLLSRAVSRQLVADVPVSAYLSGGVDTGGIVAEAVRETALSTFTCGFDMESVSGLELAFDERDRAKEMAKLMGTRHREIALQSGDMEIVMPMLVRVLEDLRVGQCYPNYYVAGLAGRYGRVVLSGTGGDELFGGYPWRYQAAMDADGWDDFVRKYYRYWQRVIPDEDKPRAYVGDVTWKIPSGMPKYVFETTLAGHGYGTDAASRADAALGFEMRTFLPGLLTVEDRVGMAHSLETRVPLLDNDLVDFALTTPFKYKVHNGMGKVLLRRALDGLLPANVLRREKQGFSAPDRSWYRGRSIDYVRHVLTDNDAKVFNVLNRGYVTERLERHFSGKSNERLFIWSMLCLELWMREFLP